MSRKLLCRFSLSLIMSQVQIPKVADILQPELDNLKLVELLVEGLEMRMEAEDAYEKALARVSGKFNSVATATTKDDCYAVLVNEMSRIHSERSFQISHFKGEMKGDIAQLKDIAKNISTELDGRLKEFKRIEKDFKVNAEKLQKSRWKSIHSHKELDERIILNQISKLNKDLSEDSKKKLAETTNKLLGEQKQINSNYLSSLDIFCSSIESLNNSLPKIVQQVNISVSRMRTQFFDIMKKYTIHEVSLVRNIQYDVDNAIRRIEKEELKDSRPLAAERFPQYVETKEDDNWDQARAELLKVAEGREVEDGGRMVADETVVQGFQKAVTGNEEDLKGFLERVNAEFVAIRDDLQRCVESYRLVNKFKFEEVEYSHLIEIFKAMTQQAYNIKDMQFLQKLLLFSITYYKADKQKRYLFEDIKNFKFYNNLQFWRFYCYFSLRAVLSNYRRNPQISASENLLHQKNSVYSTLLTCANNMIQFGIEKHSIKNFIAKAAKSFPLTEFQISEILKFIENQFNAFEMKKPKEPEVSKIVKIGKS